MTPVDREAFPDYEKYVVHPMDLSRMKSNIANGLYGSTEAFYADAQWILHNSIIFNTRELGCIEFLYLLLFWLFLCRLFCWFTLLLLMLLHLIGIYQQIIMY